MDRVLRMQRVILQLAVVGLFILIALEIVIISRLNEVKASLQRLPDQVREKLQ